MRSPVIVAASGIGKEEPPDLRRLIVRQKIAPVLEEMAAQFLFDPEEIVDDVVASLGEPYRPLKMAELLAAGLEPDPEEDLS